MPKRARWATGRTCVLVGGAPPPGLPEALAEVGFEVRTAGSAAGLPELLAAGPVGAVIVTAALGLDGLRKVAATSLPRQPLAPVLAIGASASPDDAVAAVRAGASDFAPAPAEAASIVARLRATLVAPPEPAVSGAATLERVGIYGTSPAIRTLQATLEKIGRYKANVLLLGESGTGKELVARAVHSLGPRRQHPFVPINCANLGRDILENELFGHERGAFTSADARKRGLLELADGGTIFFDEITEMELPTQAKLLRVLERNEFRRVGGTESVKVDLGLIAATNRDLERAIAEGRFREDLYYRLKVVTIAIPPLRDRKEDVPALIDTFVADFHRRTGGKIRGISPQALRELMDYDWPGNVRELKNVIESAAVLSTSETIEVDTVLDVLPHGRARARAPRPSPEVPDGKAPAVVEIPSGATLADAEQRLVLAALRRFPTKAEAASALGLGLRTLYSKLARYRAEGVSIPETD